MFSSGPSLAADDVDESEDDDPYGIHEVPVERKHLDAFAVVRPELTGEGKEKHEPEHEQTEDYMRGMKTHQRVVGRAKEIGADGEVLVGDELVPLQAGVGQKDGAQN